VQLGTNDRSQTDDDAATVKRNLRTIAQDLISNGKKVVLLVPPSETDGSPDPGFSIADVARVVNELGDELGLEVVDQLLATIMARIDGTTYLSDGLHPNDVGYRMLFDNLRERIERAGHP